jgi:hypothetical protein
MMYLAAAVPAEIRVVDLNSSGLYQRMMNDIFCSRWSAAFQKSKTLQMPAEFQSQLYINARDNFKSSRTCPSPSLTKQAIPQSQNVAPSTPAVAPSGGSLWGGIFKQ